VGRLCDASVLGAIALAVDGTPAKVYCLFTFVTLAITERRGALTVSLSRNLAALMSAMALPLVPLAPWLGQPAARPLLEHLPLVAVLVVTGRAVSYCLLRLARSARLVSEPVVIVGAGKVGVLVTQTLLAHPEYGLEPVGFVDSVDEAGLPRPVLGDIADLDRVLDTEKARRVIVAYGHGPESELVPVLRACDEVGADVHVVPRLFEFGSNYSNPCVEDLWGVPLVRLQRPASRRCAVRVKRALDVVSSTVLLVVMAPLLAVVTAAALVSSGRPVLFHQDRVGRRGTRFDLLKFRTLEVNGDDARCWSVAGDRRVTALGKVLRATSLDELPQLWNVLRGEMSLIGPRPERPHFVDEFTSSIPGYSARHRVLGGITGWAQVNGLKGDTSIDERARFDNRYIDEWSPWLDLTILFRTFTAVVRFRERESSRPAGPQASPLVADLGHPVVPDPPVERMPVGHA